MLRRLRDRNFIAHAGCACVALFLFVLAVVAQGAETSPERSATEKLSLFLALCGVLGILGNVAYSFWNRKEYDKLKDANNDLQMALDSRTERMGEEKARNERLELTLATMTTEMKRRVEKLELTNEAVVSQNLQMKAILKGLRLSGKWEGNENDIFNIHDTEQ